MFMRNMYVQPFSFSFFLNRTMLPAHLLFQKRKKKKRCFFECMNEFCDWEKQEFNSTSFEIAQYTKWMQVRK